MATRKEMVACRAWRCQWDDYQPAAFEFKKPRYGRLVVQLCLRCGSTRYRPISAAGKWLETHWTYLRPNNWPRKEAMDAQDYRKEALKHQPERARKNRLRLVQGRTG